MKNSDLKRMIANNEPFAIMKYIEWLKINREFTERKTEVIYMNGMHITKVKIGSVSGDILEKLNKVIDFNDGSVYEFNKFKEHAESLKGKYNSKVKGLIKSYKEMVDNEDCEVKKKVFSVRYEALRVNLKNYNTKFSE